MNWTFIQHVTKRIPVAEIFIRQLIDDLDGNPSTPDWGTKSPSPIRAPTIGLIFDPAMPTRLKLRLPHM